MYPSTSLRIARFVEEASKPTCKDWTDAALKAGYSPRSAWEIAKRHSHDPDIRKAIDERIAKRLAAVDIGPEMVLRHWIAVATADPSQLIRTRKLCCRYCHGVNHGYQWTAREFAEAAAKAMDQQEALPDPSGGMSYVFNADPHPDCPECQGEGVYDTFIADVSTVPEKDRVLYAGLKQTKDGIEIKMHDQQWAWDNLRDYMGMTIKRQELTGKNGQPLFPNGKLPEVVDVLPDDPKQLETLYRDMMQG